MTIIKGGSPSKKPPLPAGGESTWRPKTGHDIALTDAELAKLGFLAQAEAQCRAGISAALKGLTSLDHQQWRQLEKKPFDGLINSLQSAVAAVSDPELSRLAAEISEYYQAALLGRHQALHSIWAFDVEQERLGAWDMKRDIHLDPEHIDRSLDSIAAFTFVTKELALRVAQLIIDGLLVEGVGSRGPRVFCGTRWVKL